MKAIKIAESYSSGLDVFFDKRISTIGLEDDRLGEGGFGVVYKVERIDRRTPPLPLVAKILVRGKDKNFETVVRLQRLVRQEAQALLKQDILFFEKYPSLLALPLLSFEGSLEGEPVCGYLSINLERLGFVASNYILMDCLRDNPEEWQKFQNRSMVVKYKMAYYFAVSCAFLRRIHFIHADITPDNLFIHKFEPLCVLIDYDSGAIIDSKSDFPTTEGKQYADWTPPEMVGDREEKRLTAAVDDWAFTIALHYLFTGYQAFFTKDMSPKTIELFDEMYRDGSTVWPDIHSDSKYKDLYDDEHLKAMSQYRQYYDRLDNSVKKGFEYTFGHGAFKLSFRHDAMWWIPVLGKCVQKSPIQVDVKWRTLKEYLDVFPDIQSKKEGSVPEAWINRMHFSKDHISSEVASSPNRGLSSKSKPVAQDAPQPSPDHPLSASSHSQGSEKDSQLFDSYIKELLEDLVSGKASIRMHKGYISKMASMNGLDGNRYLHDMEDFVTLFMDSVKDGVITNFEYRALVLQAKLIKVDKTTVDKLLKPYKRK